MLIGNQLEQLTDLNYVIYSIGYIFIYQPNESSICFFFWNNNRNIMNQQFIKNKQNLIKKTYDLYL